MKQPLFYQGVREVYEPGSSFLMKLWLRRTLVQLNQYSTLPCFAIEEANCAANYLADILRLMRLKVSGVIPI